MDERLVAACKKLVVIGGVVGFSVDDLLAFLLSGMTVDQLLDIIQKSLVRIAEPCASRWVTYGLDSGGTPARERTERSAHSSV